MVLESGLEVRKQHSGRKATVLALIASTGLVIGCFLPWQQARGVFSDPGVATLDGSVVLFAALLAGGVALYSLGMGNVAIEGVFFLLIGITGLSVGVMNLRLGSIWAKVLDIGVSSIAGSGIDVVLASAALLVMAGLVGYRGSHTAVSQTVTRPGRAGRKALACRRRRPTV